MARGDDQTLIDVGDGKGPLGLRFPAGLRDRLKLSAASNNRSMNAEIVAALECWLDNHGETTQLDRIEAAVRQIAAASPATEESERT